MKSFKEGMKLWKDFLARYEEPGETRFIEPGESFCVCEELSPEAGTAIGEMYTQDIRLQLVNYPKTLQPPQPEPGSLAPLQQDTVIYLGQDSTIKTRLRRHQCL
ncbi:Uncharacterized protein HZ326_15214 [Fusarium oxysporum f. sp. albedinis]|nr:Uncharacterized protein HZ326_15214 [Fusarium oxysporum f. sp. albedinis]